MYYKKLEKSFIFKQARIKYIDFKYFDILFKTYKY